MNKMLITAFFTFSCIALVSCAQDDASAPLLREVTLHDDASKLTSEPGAYEWWNFFAVDDSQDLAVSMIFNSADPFNADYRRALAACRKADDAAICPHPADYSLLQLQVTFEGETLFSALRNPPGATVEFSATTAEGRIDRSTFRGSYVDGVKQFAVHIDAPSTSNELRLEADILLAAGAPGFTVAGDGLYRSIDDGERHAWQFPIGNPLSSGHLRITSREKGVLLETDLMGGGYMDHMWGEALLTDILDSWHFGTASLGQDGTLIYVWLTPRFGMGTASGFAFLETPGQLATGFEISSLDSAEPNVGMFGLEYDAAITLTLADGSTIAATLDPLRLAADWPFQVAGPAMWDISMFGRFERQGVVATSEYLWQPGIDSETYYGMFDYVQETVFGEDWW